MAKRPTTRAGREERAGTRRGQTSGQHRAKTAAKRLEENYSASPGFHRCVPERDIHVPCGGIGDEHVCVQAHGGMSEACWAAWFVAYERGVVDPDGATDYASDYQPTGAR